MNDRHLDPPEIYEQPEWLELINDGLETPGIPQGLRVQISELIENHFAAEAKAEADALAQMHYDEEWLEQPETPQGIIVDEFLEDIAVDTYRETGRRL